MDNGNEPIWSRRKSDSGTPETHGIQHSARVIPRMAQSGQSCRQLLSPSLGMRNLALSNKLVLIGFIPVQRCRQHNRRDFDDAGL